MPVVPSRCLSIGTPAACEAAASCCSLTRTATWGGCWLGVKLPESKEDALALPFSRLMGYGLDRGGWVGIQAPPDMPLEVLTRWVEESYRTVAPKVLRGSRAKPGDSPGT